MWLTVTRTVCFREKRRKAVKGSVLLLLVHACVQSLWLTVTRTVCFREKRRKAVKGCCVTGAQRTSVATRKVGARLVPYTLSAETSL